jgi:hypothetical protein
MFSHWIISTIRAQETVDATSPAEVLRRLEREQADYLSYVAGTTDRGTYRALLDAVARATTWAPILDDRMAEARRTPGQHAKEHGLRAAVKAVRAKS